MLKHRLPSFILCGIFIWTCFIVLLIVPDKGEAMPGWARKYRFSCTVCHAPFPRLKDYGDEFAGNGFRLPEGEPRRASHDTGDPMLQLARDVPIGFRMDIFGTYEPEGITERTPAEDQGDFKTPYNVKILTGGPLSEHFAYYFYFFFSEHGEIAGLEDAFIFISDLFGSGVNLTLGQFAVSDPLFKGELRLTFEGYEIFKRKPERSYANLKYDRGIVLDYGFDFGLDMVLQVVNGNGIGEDHGLAKSFDQDNRKNVMFRASQDIGPVRIGGFTYFGSEKNTATDSDSDFRENKLAYYGGDATVSVGPVELNGLFMVRKDCNPTFTAAKKELESTAFMAEAVYLPKGDDGPWAISALYNNFDSEEEFDYLDYESATLNVSYLLRRNARMMAEYTRILKDCSRNPDGEEMDRFLIGLVTGF